MFSLPHQRPRRNGAAAQSGSTPEIVGRPRCGARARMSPAPTASSARKWGRGPWDDLGQRWRSTTLYSIVSGD